jgi:hypothetical protein
MRAGPGACDGGGGRGREARRVSGEAYGRRTVTGRSGRRRGWRGWRGWCGSAARGGFRPRVSMESLRTRALGSPGPGLVSDSDFYLDRDGRLRPSARVPGGQLAHRDQAEAAVSGS